MYRYDEFDAAYVKDRVASFRRQVERRIDGSITEDEFKPLRLMNGLYLQLHAYMLRVAIPYGTLNSRQMRTLAMIAGKWDKGYGHLTTRQNIQYNWPALKDVPDILDALADVEMHAIQTSGNCTADEIEDPRPTAELIRQWSTEHPEFLYLPRKFKIAVTGSPNDRAVTKAHDIGLRMLRNDTGEPGYEVIVGGGLGRSPFVGKVMRDFLPKADLLPYLEAILRVYNLQGRRDNKYKARIKILVHETGTEELRAMIEKEFEKLDGPSVAADPVDQAKTADADFAAWVDANTDTHQQPGYTIVTVSAKAIGEAPGDLTMAQMNVLADLAEQFSHDELRISHEQNVILPHVKKDDLQTIHAALADAGLSIPVAQDIQRRFADPVRARAIGEFKIKISGCINACGHHHVGHVGILGLEKAGIENYQITLGGDHTETAAIGDRAGPGFSFEQVGPAIERLVDAYIELRASDDERFLDTYRRLGLDPFKAALYGEPQQEDPIPQLR